MSAFGTKRTSELRRSMSAFGVTDMSKTDAYLLLSQSRHTLGNSQRGCDPVPAHIDRWRRDRPSLVKPRLRAPMHCLRLRLRNRPYLLVSELIRVDRCAGTICLPKLFLTGLFVGEFDETIAHH